MPKHKNKHKKTSFASAIEANKKLPVEEPFHWKLNKIAFDFPSEAKRRLTSNFLIKEVIPSLQKWQLQKWKKVENYHENYFVNAAKTENQKLLDWLSHNEIQPEEIFSFYLGKEQGRLFGIRNVKIFEILWHDENHEFYLKLQPDWEERNFSWSMEALDFNFPNNVKEKLTPEILKEKIIPRLQYYEDKTWGQIIGKEKKEHHFVDFKESKDKKKRVLNWLKKNPNYKSSDFFSFRIASRKRLYGVIENAVFKILFYDHDHNFYPTNKS